MPRATSRAMRSRRLSSSASPAILQGHGTAIAHHRERNLQAQQLPVLQRFGCAGSYSLSRQLAGYMPSCTCNTGLSRSAVTSFWRYRPISDCPA